MLQSSPCLFFPPPPWRKIRICPPLFSKTGQTQKNLKRMGFLLSDVSWVGGSWRQEAFLRNERLVQTNKSLGDIVGDSCSRPICKVGFSLAVFQVLFSLKKYIYEILKAMNVFGIEAERLDLQLVFGRNQKFLANLSVSGRRRDKNCIESLTIDAKRWFHPSFWQRFVPLSTQKKAKMTTTILLLLLLLIIIVIIIN